MIDFVRGTLAVVDEGAVVVEWQGMGLRIGVSATTGRGLAVIGQEVRLLTVLHLREEQVALFGFATEGERDLFRLLLSVAGVGPKVALSLLSTLEPDALRRAVAAQDVAALSRASGVGKRLAQRIAVELKGRVGMPEGEEMPTVPLPGEEDTPRAEARAGLVGLGITAEEADWALQRAEGDDAKKLLRSALQVLATRR